MSSKCSNDVAARFCCQTSESQWRRDQNGFVICKPFSKELLLIPRFRVQDQDPFSWQRRLHPFCQSLTKIDCGSKNKGPITPIPNLQQHLFQYLVLTFDLIVPCQSLRESTVEEHNVNASIETVGVLDNNFQLGFPF